MFSLPLRDKSNKAYLQQGSAAPFNENKKEAKMVKNKDRDMQSIVKSVFFMPSGLLFYIILI